MKIKALDLHNIAIIADWWLKDHKMQISTQAETAKALRDFCSHFKDNTELTLDEMPF